MSTFLLFLLTVFASAGAGWFFGLVTDEEANEESNADTFSEAREVWSDISADVQRAEEQIQRLARPNPGRRSQP